jgi:hypothetical protein
MRCVVSRSVLLADFDAAAETLRLDLDAAVTDPVIELLARAAPAADFAAEVAADAAGEGVGAQRQRRFGGQLRPMLPLWLETR